MPPFYLLLLLSPNVADPLAGPRAFVADHCVRCHGADKKAGGVRLDDLTAADVERWASVRDQVRDGLMPPPKSPRPDAAKARELVAAVSRHVGRVAGRLPNQGNLIPHELLFGGEVPPAEAPPERLWRLSPKAYLGFVQTVTRGKPSLTQPFTLVPERGIRDFAGLYSIDEPSTEILLRNAEAIVESQTAHAVEDGKVKGRNDSVREFVALMDAKSRPTRAALESAVRLQFKMAVGRSPDAGEVSRLLDLYDKCAAGGDTAGAAKTMLQAVLLRADAMFRAERGAGDGAVKTLAGVELATAISLTLTDKRDPTLAAALDGKAATRPQIAAAVRKLLDDPKVEKPKLLAFFREYFGYGAAADVFKDKPAGFAHAPAALVADTDALILHVLREDKDVLRQLLTTDRTFANYSFGKDNKTRLVTAKPAVVPQQPSKKALDKGAKPVKAPEAVYGFDEWPKDQPAPVPGGKRLGVLMQPAWLVSFSTNFETDPVRRGRWVRERLLGGTVPDLPIGVAAVVPDDKHHTFRTRLKVTREAACWKCHQRMDPLGLPFEQFDHYGRHRTTESVLDREATAKNVDKRGKSLGEVTREEALDTTGEVGDSGDSALDGGVKTPHEMVRRLAASERVRQVFVRHVFRYVMGRNETLGDAKSLRDADAAYAASGGSFKALLVSLMTSDAFLLRRAAAPTTGEGR